VAAYKALRFIDLFRPGDEIPAGTYDDAMLAKLVARGVVEQIEESVQAKEAEPKDHDDAPKGKVTKKRS
jgi:hypothetical protein